MSLPPLFAKLAAHGIGLAPVGGGLRVRSLQPPPPDLMAALTAEKAEATALIHPRPEDCRIATLRARLAAGTLNGPLDLPWAKADSLAQVVADGLLRLSRTRPGSRQYDAERANLTQIHAHLTLTKGN